MTKQEDNAMACKLVPQGTEEEWRTVVVAAADFVVVREELELEEVAC